MHSGTGSCCTLQQAGPEARQEVSPPLEASVCEAGRVGKRKNKIPSPF